MLLIVRFSGFKLLKIKGVSIEYLISIFMLNLPHEK